MEQNHRIMQKLDPIKVSWIIRAKGNWDEKCRCCLIHEDINTLGVEIVLVISQYRNISNIEKTRIRFERTYSNSMQGILTGSS